MRLWMETGFAIGGRRGFHAGISPPAWPGGDSPTYPQGCSRSMSLILASGSAIRHSLLAAAGVDHRVEPSSVDEGPVQSAHDGDDSALALALASAKALDVSARLSENWVVGADSLVSVDGRRFAKPRNRDEAADHLAAFSGRPM